MNKKVIDLSVFITVLLSGFYGGTGFFIAIGGNPALKMFSDATFAEYWQYIDRYMAARMPVFGPLLMLSLLISSILLLVSKFRIPGTVMIVAFAVMVGDLIFTLTTNHPLNGLIQSWNLNDLPDNVQQIKWKVINAFQVRLSFMIAVFVLTLCSLWIYFQTRLNNYKK